MSKTERAPFGRLPRAREDRSEEGRRGFVPAGEIGDEFGDRLRASEGGARRGRRPSGGVTRLSLVGDDG